jgi:hypothetical protein
MCLLPSQGLEQQVQDAIEALVQKVELGQGGYRQQDDAGDPLTEQEVEDVD